MRLTCGSHVVGCVWWHLQLLFAARGPPKTSSEPRRGRGIVFRNSRISLSAGRRACEPAAKPAIPGVILLHNGFVWPTTHGTGGTPLVLDSEMALFWAIWVLYYRSCTGSCTGIPAGRRRDFFAGNSSNRPEAGQSELIHHGPRKRTQTTNLIRGTRSR